LEQATKVEHLSLAKVEEGWRGKLFENDLREFMFLTTRLELVQALYKMQGPAIQLRRLIITGKKIVENQSLLNMIRDRRRRRKKKKMINLLTLSVTTHVKGCQCHASQCQFLGS
jgi:hypothetical protein